MIIIPKELSEEIRKEVQECGEGAKVEDYLIHGSDDEMYGIFHLTPRECGRLMGVTDADIDRMTSVNSNTQLYKQFGNSIVVPVLMGIFSQLNISGIKAWNDMNETEIEELLDETRYKK